ncbi:aminodeoxychorismate lyase [Aestuariicella hydrocarbonica]|uniref:Aminodeoxychorismate lyase n=1 Tax=Pseudomaricurvus hydrocarbonicus TaxID=1470433 RepID=A0A9E5MGW8_9GAMM|nr:aminodeoxychorismate lyase [Aestuariicella hydrocarbonica]NHO65241.1 aminodeoxychorismate lyase [Aestuariicella hydrocarbonica]
MTVISVNGQLGPSVSALDRGLAFGDGVFESMRLLKGQLPLWSYHRSRLVEGCQRLSIPVDITSVENWVQKLISDAAAEKAEGVLKIIVTRGAGGRGYGIDPTLVPTVVCSLHPPPPALSRQPVNLHLCQQRLSINPVLAEIKHLNRLENILLKAECQKAGFEDGLVMDADERVVETTSSNVFLERDGQLYTPSLKNCGVDGVMRRFIINELLPVLNINVEIAAIDLTSLPTFNSVFVCNSVRGIVEVSKIGDVIFSPGEVIDQLQRVLSESRFGS